MAQQTQKQGGKSNNGQGKTSPIEDSDTQNSRRRAKKAAQKVANKGMHKETMTSGLAADREAKETAFRKNVVEFALEGLRADSARLKDSLDSAAKDRKGPISMKLSGINAAIELIEQFRDAGYKMKLRWRDAVESIYGSAAIDGRTARQALYDAFKEVKSQ